MKVRETGFVEADALLTVQEGELDPDRCFIQREHARQILAESEMNGAQLRRLAKAARALARICESMAR